jgi:hypothetical protein
MLSARHGLFPHPVSIFLGITPFGTHGGWCQDDKVLPLLSWSPLLGFLFREYHLSQIL